MPSSYFHRDQKTILRRTMVCPQQGIRPALPLQLLLVMMSFPLLAKAASQILKTLILKTLILKTQILKRHKMLW